MHVCLFFNYYYYFILTHCKPVFDLWPSYFEKYFKKELETWVQVGVVVSAALQVALLKKKEMGTKAFLWSWGDGTVSLQRLLMNRPRCACPCKAGYKGSVGPSATGSQTGAMADSVGLLLCCWTNTPSCLIGREGCPIGEPQTCSALLLLARPQRAHSLAPRLDYSIWISAPITHFSPCLPSLAFVMA